MKNIKTQKVEDRRTFIILSDVVLKVSESGRKRVIKDKAKNVHAGVVGMNNVDINQLDLNQTWMQLKYNPYFTPQFGLYDDENGCLMVFKAPYAILNEQGLWIPEIKNQSYKTVLKPLKELVK